MCLHWEGDKRGPWNPQIYLKEPGMIFRFSRVQEVCKLNWEVLLLFLFCFHFYNLNYQSPLEELGHLRNFET